MRHRITPDEIIVWVDDFFKRSYLFIYDRGEGREKERERKINVWLPLMCPPLGSWPAAQVCVLTGNRTSDPLVHRLVFNPLSNTSQGWVYDFFHVKSFLNVAF